MPLNKQTKIKQIIKCGTKKDSVKSNNSRKPVVACRTDERLVHQSGTWRA